jgi:hypothetical protein
VKKRRVLAFPAGQFSFPAIVIPDPSITLRLVPTYVDIPSDPGLTP